jgi:hypothetical protein
LNWKERNKEKYFGHTKESAYPTKAKGF